MIGFHLTICSKHITLKQSRIFDIDRVRHSFNDVCLGDKGLVLEIAKVVSRDI